MRRFIIAICFLILSNSCAMYHSRPLTDAVNQDKLKLGMNQQEVRKVIGKPDEVAKRRVSAAETKEVWAYYEYDPTLRGCSMLMLSCTCSKLFVPFKPKLQYVVFQNGELIGWNIPDPIAVEVIEKNRQAEQEEM